VEFLNGGQGLPLVDVPLRVRDDDPAAGDDAGAASRLVGGDDAYPHLDLGPVLVRTTGVDMTVHRVPGLRQSTPHTGADERQTGTDEEGA
jgi:hypothetical protein